MKAGILFVTICVLGCQSNDSIFLRKDIRWGMSMSEIKAAYKTDPIDKGSDFLDFNEHFYAKNETDLKVRLEYIFDSQKGLVHCELKADAQSQGENAAVIELMNSRDWDVYGTLIEEQKEYVAGDRTIGGDFVFVRRIVFDRLYKSRNNETINIQLTSEKDHLSKDSLYHLTKGFLAPTWKFKLTPSTYRTKHEFRRTKK